MRGRCNGVKLCIEVAVATFMRCWVGERFVSLRRCVVRYVGGIRSANVDISNDKAGEKFVRRKIKGFCLTLIGVG